MPPESVRPSSRKAAQVLPEVAKVAFLLEAAHMLSDKAPAVSRQLGKRVLQASGMRVRHQCVDVARFDASRQSLVMVRTGL